MNIALATNNAVDSLRCGELNGLASTAACLGEAFAPLICAPFFAWSISGNHPFPFGAHFSYLLLALGMLAFSIVGWGLVKYEPAKQQESRAEFVEMDPVGDLM